MAKTGRPLSANYKAKEYWYKIFQEEQAKEKELAEKREHYQRHLDLEEAKKRLKFALNSWSIDCDTGMMKMYEGSFEALFNFLKAVGFKFEMEGEE